MRFNIDAIALDYVYRCCFMEIKGKSSYVWDILACKSKHLEYFRTCCG